MKYLSVFFLIVLVFMFLFGIVKCYELLDLRYNGVITSAKIIELNETACAETSICYFYTVKFYFKDSIENIAKLSSYVKYGSIGDTMLIMYDPYNMENLHEVDDYSLFKNYIIGNLFLLLAIISLIWCLFNINKVEIFIKNYIK
ncbi:MAG: hypothetical protein IPK03_00685 [Bacteroidetes bacterium]|nr:hypothetical protein [Bacteroidota bacterium]